MSSLENLSETRKAVLKDTLSVEINKEGKFLRVRALLPNFHSITVSEEDGNRLFGKDKFEELVAVQYVVSLKRLLQDKIETLTELKKLQTMLALFG